jgi:2-keto-4-pentenoate hydratase/2-oxohepta-3-ene-1,7-dioic acid hydratase in catechol pathway
MKIIRTRDDSGCIVHLSEINEREGFLIEGNLFGEFEVGTNRLPIRERLAPVHPGSIIGIAQNYRAHAEEMGGALPEFPVFFTKLPHALLDPGKPIRLPRHLRSDKVDFEAELAVVIGKNCRNVSPDEALSYVLGYTAANDVSARDWQKEWGGGQFCRARASTPSAPSGRASSRPMKFPIPANSQSADTSTGTSCRTATPPTSSSPFPN